VSEGLSRERPGRSVTLISEGIQRHPVFDAINIAVTIVSFRIVLRRNQTREFEVLSRMPTRACELRGRSLSCKVQGGQLSEVSIIL
jgi:hypothetical protein